MASSSNGDSKVEFARSFRSALRKFMGEQGQGPTGVASALGITNAKTSKPAKQRINNYLREPPSPPEGQILYLACTRLEGFRFEHEGFRLIAQAVPRNGAAPQERPAKQMAFRFRRKFNFTDQKGSVIETGAFLVKVKRPPGRVEVSLSLKAGTPSR